MKKEGKKNREKERTLCKIQETKLLFFVSDWLIIVLVFKQITNHGSWKSEEILDCF